MGGWVGGWVGYVEGRVAWNRRKQITTENISMMHDIPVENNPDNPADSIDTSVQFR